MLLHCGYCGKPISATYKVCPHCGRKISLLMDIMSQIEHNKLYLAGVTVLAILLLGVGWFLRMDSGVRWPLYLIILLVAPVVPWLLQLAYKAAAPLEKDKERDKS